MDRLTLRQFERQAPSWSFLDRFTAPRAGATWASVGRWVRSAVDATGPAEEELGEQRKRWRKWLAPLPEVSDQDWRDFRPLRLSREEAWSDWLAHLLTASKTGEFAHLLFLGEEAGLQPLGGGAVVAREVRIADGDRRADILLRWKDVAVHVEVKVGDQEFEKTFETAAALRKEYGDGVRSWLDFILLPPADLDTWESVAAGRARRSSQVVPITWRDVAVALRRVLRDGREDLAWNTWAHSFCGAVEQRILGCIPFSEQLQVASALARVVAAAEQLSLMKEAGE